MEETTITQLQAIMSDRCNVTRSQIIDFCQQWKIIEFALFGSVLRDDFRDDSDIRPLAKVSALTLNPSPKFGEGL